MTKILKELSPGSMLDTARTVRKLNPSAANYTEEGLVTQMWRQANALMHEHGHGYVSLLGYTITVFIDEKGQPYAVPSVMTHTAKMYAARMEKIELAQNDALGDIIKMAQDAKYTNAGFWCLSGIIETATKALKKAEKE